MNIDFLPINSLDFEFSSIFEESFSFENPNLKDAIYPFKEIKYFFLQKKKLTGLNLDETRITDDNFEKFKNIFLRGDYFYLIAFHYFLNIHDYSFEAKSEGIMRVQVDGSYKNISFFQELYNALQKTKNDSQTLLRHEYTIVRHKYKYINNLSEFLLNDFEELDKAIRKERNVFAKYGNVIKEVYIEIFRDFYSNFIDYLSNENFEKIKNIVYPSKKEVQSFRFAVRKNWKNLSDMEARRMVIDSIHKNLKNEGFVSDITTYEQIDDLFNNKRREFNKIIWLKSLTALKTLYTVMQENKIIEDAEGKHWKILADYFLLGDSDIDFKELGNKKKSTDFKTNQDLESVFYFLINQIRA
ncbi:MAG: hypothetical protein QM564_03885 [Bergeyella sp.]